MDGPETHEDFLKWCEAKRDGHLIEAHFMSVAQITEVALEILKRNFKTLEQTKGKL